MDEDDHARQPAAHSALTAPAAERNKQPILDVLQRVLPAQGTVLEIASGTGQHVAHFAAALPRLTWQPSEPDPAMRASIAARVSAMRLPNVLAPIDLDVTRPAWGVDAADAIVCINMVHIAAWRATLALLAGGARLLAPGAILFLYGPYRRGDATAPSNLQFDVDLRARDPEWGVRELDDVRAAAAVVGFSLDEIVPMPANNFSLVLRRTPPG